MWFPKFALATLPSTNPRSYSATQYILTSVTNRLCDSFFLAFMILTIAASILKQIVSRSTIKHTVYKKNTPGHPYIMVEGTPYFLIAFHLVTSSKDVNLQLLRDSTYTSTLWWILMFSVVVNFLFSLSPLWVRFTSC